MTMQAKLMKRVWTEFLKIGERYVGIGAHSDLEIISLITFQTSIECKVRVDVCIVSFVKWISK